MLLTSFVNFSHLLKYILSCCAEDIKYFLVLFRLFHVITCIFGLSVSDDYNIITMVLHVCDVFHWLYN